MSWSKDQQQGRTRNANIYRSLDLTIKATDLQSVEQYNSKISRAL